MANDNHLFSVTCYNVTMQKQDYYNEFFELGQQKINFSHDKRMNDPLFSDFACCLFFKNLTLLLNASLGAIQLHTVFFSLTVYVLILPLFLRYLNSIF